MLVNKSSVRWTTFFGNGTEIDRQRESAATLNAFLTACISFFLLICWHSSITKDNRPKILCITQFKKTQVKFNKRGFFLHNWFVLGSYDELNLWIGDLKCSCFFSPKIVSLVEFHKADIQQTKIKYINITSVDFHDTNKNV